MTTPLEQRYKYNNNLIVYFYGGNEIINDLSAYLHRTVFKVVDENDQPFKTRCGI
jgi:hypothetical protein